MRKVMAYVGGFLLFGSLACILGIAGGFDYREANQIADPSFREMVPLYVATVVQAVLGWIMVKKSGAC